MLCTFIPFRIFLLSTDGIVEQALRHRERGLVVADRFNGVVHRVHVRCLGIHRRTGGPSVYPDPGEPPRGAVIVTGIGAADQFGNRGERRIALFQNGAFEQRDLGFEHVIRNRRISCRAASQWFGQFRP